MQCELSISVFLETAIVLLWLWLWFIFTVQLISTITLLIRIVGSHFVTHETRMNRLSIWLGQPDAKLAFSVYMDLYSKAFDEFATTIMSADGLLMLDIIEDNVSVMAVYQLVTTAWFLIQKRKETVELIQSRDDSGAVKLIACSNIEEC